MTTEWSRVNTYISQCERHRRSPILSTRCSGLVERRNSSLTIIRKYRKGLRSGVSRLKRTMLRKIEKKKRIIVERTDHRSPRTPWKRTCANEFREVSSREGYARTLARICVCTRFIQDPSFRINVTGAPRSNEIRTSARFFSGFSTLGSSVSSRYRNPVCTARYQSRPRVPCTLSSLGTIVRRPSHVHHLRSRNQCIDIGIAQLATRKSSRSGVPRFERIQRSFTDFAGTREAFSPADRLRIETSIAGS